MIYETGSVLVNGGTFTLPGGAAARADQNIPVHDEDDLFGNSAAIDELETFGKGEKNAFFSLKID